MLAQHHLQPVAVIALLGLLSGCQAWPGANFPIQNAARVPPPGTGTYQLPSGYYNNNTTSSLPSTTQVPQAVGQSLQASSVNQPPTSNRLVAGQIPAAGGFLPSTDLVARGGSDTAPSSPAFASPVVTASHAEFSNPPIIAVEAGHDPAPHASTPEFSAASAGQATSAGGAAQLSDSDVPSLRWQQ